MKCIWELSAAPAPSGTSLETDLHCDLLIIGGGYSGLSTALHLKDSGLNVALIEAHSIGWGASGRNGGHVIPLIRLDPDGIISALGDTQGRRLLAMISESADYVFSLIEQYNIDCAAERNGWIQAIHSQAQMQVAKARVQQWQSFNSNMEVFDANASAELMGTKAYLGALVLKSAGHINPLSYARGLAQAVIKEGIKVFTDTPALGIEPAGSRWLVKTPKGTINAEKIVLATAAYGDGLWPNLQKSFLPFYLYNVATKPLQEPIQSSILPNRQAVTDTRGDAHVFHYDQDGRLITGGTFIFTHNWEKRLLRHANKVLRSTFPQIGEPEFEMEHMWRGKISMTKDLLPHMHVLAPNVYTWLGCNARGIALSTCMGSVLADALMGVDNKDWGLQATRMETISMHGFSKFMTSSMLGYYRVKDRFHF